jgi:hypothetical protein
VKRPQKGIKRYPISYELDRIDDQDFELYRVQIKIGSQSLTRLYQEDGDALKPVGYWTRKE